MPEPLQPLVRRAALRESNAGQPGDDSDDGVVIRPLPPRARFCLRLSPSLLPRASSAAGFSLDIPINRCSLTAGKRTLRLGPDEWLLSASERDTATIAQSIETALAGLHHSLVDVSHARVAMSVSGTRAPDVINCGCALDLSETAFSAGTATRTLLAKAEIVLARWEAAPAFEVETSRSLADYVSRFLEHSARQFRALDG